MNDWVRQKLSKNQKYEALIKELIKQLLFDEMLETARFFNREFHKIKRLK